MNDTNLDHFTDDERATHERIQELDAFVSKVHQEESTAFDVVKKAAVRAAGWVGIPLYIGIPIYAGITGAEQGTTSGNIVVGLVVVCAAVTYATYKLVEHFHPRSKERYRHDDWLPAYREARELEQSLATG